MIEPHFLTFESGPSDPITLADGPGTYAELEVEAPVRRLWDLVTDINLPAQFSTEFKGADWVGDEHGIGAVFVGTNENEYMGEWSLDLTVFAHEPMKCFGWCSGSLEVPAASWLFELDERNEDCRLRFSVRFGPGESGLSEAIRQRPQRESQIIMWRLQDLRKNMVRTVEGIKALAEQAE